MNSSIICDILKMINDNFSQIISVFGTLSGAILGWLLKYLQENIGKTEISVDDFKHYKDESYQYAYNLKLFICNHSLNPKYVKNLRVAFFDKRKIIFETNPKSSDTENTFFSFCSERIIDIIKLKYNEPVNIILCDVLQMDKVLKANKIILRYKNEKGKVKKITIKRNTPIYNVAQYPHSKIFPN